MNGRVKEERCTQFARLSKLLQKHYTYPDVILTIQVLICMGSDTVLQDFPTPTSHIDQLLLQATTSQHQLGNNMSSKGLLCKD